MTTKRDFSSSEWKQIINAPQLIYHAFISGERTNILQKRSEAKALSTFLGGHKSSSSLVKSMINDQDEADDKIDGSYETTMLALKKVGSLLDKKAPGSDGDAARRMLSDAAEAIAEAVKELPSLRSKDAVSKKEKEIIDDVEEALQATAADARERRAAARKSTASSSSSRAKSAAAGAAGLSAAEMARRQREVDERAAARRAEKEKEAMSAAEMERRQREVEERAAARRSEKKAEDRKERKIAAQKAALERREAREAKERATKRAAAQKKAREARAKAAVDARAAKENASKAAKARIKTAQKANPGEAKSKARMANRALTAALKDVRTAKTDREREYRIDEVYELLDEYESVIPTKREELIIDRLTKYEQGAIDNDGDEDEELIAEQVNVRLVENENETVAKAMYKANVHRWTDIYAAPAGDPHPGALSPSTQVNVLSEDAKGQWVEIHADGGSVWIPKDSITPLKKQAVAAKASASQANTRVVGRWTDVYDGPGGNKVAGVCSPDTVVTVMEWGPKRNWLRINAQGMNVWIPADSLK